jgi:RNA polymerase sigma-70 factor (ECF subfamily)
MNSFHEDFLKRVSEYQGIIHKVNLVYFKTKSDREDNFQEVVFQLWKSFSSLKDMTKIGSWMYSVAINTSISKIRKDKRYVLMDTLPDIPHTDDEENFVNKINSEQLLDAIQKLNVVDKSIMLLYLEEYSYEQIADIIGISVSNVGVRINRAKKQLKTIILTNKK